MTASGLNALVEAILETEMDLLSLNVSVGHAIGHAAAIGPRLCDAVAGTDLASEWQGLAQPSHLCCESRALQGTLSLHPSLAHPHTLSPPRLVRLLLSASLS
eukprot:3403236-Rhodomonas_salina.1